MTLSAQTVTTLASFDNTDGASPNVGLVQAANGGFYGITQYGGLNGLGTFFGINPEGALTKLHSMYCAKCGGDIGASGLIQATDGDFYGTTQYGGTGERCLLGCGTVFKITARGDLTRLHSFNFADGDGPGAGLMQATDGDLYGTTTAGGNSGSGTVFKITPGGELTTLYSFCAQAGCTDGGVPRAALMEGADGTFYGTTQGGGEYNGGTVFRITPGGVLTTLYSFCAQTECTDGAGPVAPLVEATNGDLYGTTLQGGANRGGVPFGGGTAFKITPAGALTALYSFCSRKGCADGQYPSGLVQGRDGDFYGTTDGTTYKTIYGGDANQYGTIFKLTPGGALTTLYRFCSQSGCTDGYYPQTGLVEAANGGFYGTTAAGGTGEACGVQGCGTVFELSTRAEANTPRSGILP